MHACMLCTELYSANAYCVSRCFSCCSPAGQKRPRAALRGHCDGGGICAAAHTSSRCQLTLIPATAQKIKFCMLPV